MKELVIIDCPGDNDSGSKETSFEVQRFINSFSEYLVLMKVSQLKFVFVTSWWTIKEVHSEVFIKNLN